MPTYNIERPSWDIRTSVWGCRTARNLPLADSAATWSPLAAAERMLDAAGIGTDAPRIAEAARGFLYFDSGNPTRRESYAFPIADITAAGAKVVHQAAIEAAQRELLIFLPVDQFTAAEAQGLIDCYMRQFRAAPHRRFGGAPYTRTAGAITRFAGFGARQADCVISHSKRALDGIRVLTSGIDYTEYEQRGAPVLLHHDHTRPVARMMNLHIQGDELRGTIQWPSPELSTQDAEDALKQVLSRVLAGISIGWLPDIAAIKMEPGGPVHTRSQLLEISICAVPSLPGAQVTATRSARSRPPDDARSHAVGDTPAAAWLRRKRAETRKLQFDREVAAQKIRRDDAYTKQLEVAGIAGRKTMAESKQRELRMKHGLPIPAHYGSGSWIMGR